MKVDKNLQKVISRMVKESFSHGGKVEEKKAVRFCHVLRSLATVKAIAALSLYLRLLRNEMKKYTLEVETTLPLSKKQTKRVVEVATKNYSVQTVNTILNRDLLGGMRVKIGDMVYDNSLDQKILQVKGAING